MPHETDIDLDRIEKVQKSLHATLIDQAKKINVAKGDWAQGGWSRSSKDNLMDRVDVGIAPGLSGHVTTPVTRPG